MASTLEARIAVAERPLAIASVTTSARAKRPNTRTSHSAGAGTPGRTSASPLRLFA